ncbi:transcriptional regulator [Alkalispirochaeta odontotermitis]|nr:transcriptional regulator [Alkalispirochaeta odontotermitis]CAB1083716.1 Transcriptional regulatory protein RtcR [Olavius algarvensis Delta 1 endosymbiont]
MKKLVVIGLLGPTLDMGKRSKRWERWRPTVALCQHEDLLVNRFELLYQKRFKSLQDRVVKDIQHISPETEVVSHAVDFRDPWDLEEVYGALHDFAKAYAFDPDSEEYLVHITTGTHVAQICLYLLTESNYLPAKLIQTSPSPGKSKDHDVSGEYRIIDLDLSKYDRIAMRFRQELDDDITFLKSGIETRNEAFNALIERIEQVAVNSTDPVLITGPTGAGKSNLARRIYELKKSRRQLKGDFIEINCATLRGDAAMSALFGHKKGAFTGAARDRDGLLRAADKGMLFLDEVGELGLDEQSMLLRAIEEKKFLPLGSDEETQSDFQLICGTNRDLSVIVANGCFRDDLLSRINLWTFHMPGLAQRPEDIEPNLKFELDRFAERNNVHVTFNREARKQFLAFATSSDALWSANFRDLNGAVTRMSTLAPGGRITKEVVQEEIARLNLMWRAKTADNQNKILDAVIGTDRAGELDRFEKVQLADVLKVCKDSKSMSEAGRKVFAVSRTKKRITNDADRLRKYLARYNIQWGDL